MKAVKRSKKEKREFMEVSGTNILTREKEARGTRKESL